MATMSLLLRCLMVLCLLMTTVTGQLLADDDSKDSPMYGIGEPQSAVPPAFRQSNAPADVAMTKKVQEALKRGYADANLYVTTTTDHTVYLRGFTQGNDETKKIVA